MNRHKSVSSLQTWIFLIATVSVLSACRSSVPTANASQEKGVPVKIELVRSAIVDNSEEFNATLESRQSVTLRPRIEGQVARIFVRAGDSVKAGDLIVQIDSRKQAASASGAAAATDSALASVATKRSGVTSARATLKSLEADRTAKLADVEFNQNQYRSFAQLYQRGGISRQTLRQYENSLKVAKANLEAANARLQAQQDDINAKQGEVTQAERGYQQAQTTTEGQQVELQYYRITAPFAGTIGALPAKEGDFVNTSTALANLTQNNALEVNVSIPTEKVKQMRVGTQIDLINAQGQTVGSSRVFMISPNVAADTQTVLVKALVDNANGSLRTDQQIRARVIWERSPGMLVPTTAISRIAGQDFIFVAEQSNAGLVAVQKPIKLGVIRGNDQQVLDGLKPGDKIVTTGLAKIGDGALILNEAELTAPQKM